MKKVLVISYWFPPDNLPGSYRVGKFVKYLPKFGWEPIVLSARKPRNSHRPPDPTLLEDLPVGTDIIRTLSIEPLAFVLRLAKMMKKTPPMDGLAGHSNQQVAFKASSMRRIAKMFYAAVIEQPFSIPDPYVGWVPSSVMKACKIIGEKKPSAIFTSSPPLSTHVIGLLLKKRFDIPWVADFRDVWPSLFQHHKNIFDKINDKIGFTILRNADKIVAVSKPMCEEFIFRDPDRKTGKYELIYNGFDPDDYRRIEPTDFGRFTILHTGEVFDRDPSGVLNAIRELVRDGLIGDDFQIIFLGTVSRNFFSEAEQVGRFVKVYDPVPHREALKFMLGSDILLLLVGERKDHSITIPAKFFEYLFANKPILAISPDGAIPELINKANLGFVYGPAEKDAIKACILQSYHRWKNRSGKQNRDEQFVTRFSREFLTKELASFLDEVSSRKYIHDTGVLVSAKCYRRE